LRDSAAKFHRAAGRKSRADFLNAIRVSRPRGCDKPENLAGLASSFRLPRMDSVLASPNSLWCLNRPDGLVCEPIGLRRSQRPHWRKAHPASDAQTCDDRLGAGRTGAAGECARRRHACARTQAAETDGSLRLTGTRASFAADGADGFLVSAAGATDRHYICGTPCSREQSVDNADRGRPQASTLDLKDAPGDLIPSRQSSRSAVEAVTDLALIALSAELLA